MIKVARERGKEQRKYERGRETNYESKRINEVKREGTKERRRRKRETRKIKEKVERHENKTG